MGSEKVVRTSGGFGFDATPLPNAEMPGGGRQVSARGNWAEFATHDGRTYFANVPTGEKTWTRPLECASTMSQRKADVGPTPQQTKLFVGSLPEGVNDQAFRSLFSPFGNIVDMKCVPANRYGFVRYFFAGCWH